MATDLSELISRLHRHQQMLDRMIFRIASTVDPDAECNETVRLWGEKESAASTIVKLSQVQIRWVELELDLLRLFQNLPTTEAKQASLNEEELEIFHQALHRWEESRQAHEAEQETA